MSQHQSFIQWQRSVHPAEPQTYSRNHRTTLNGGQQIDVSASPAFKGDPECTDPEQLLVSALGSCHMLTFLAIAELQGYQVERYEDRPTGHMEKVDGKTAVTRIELSPKVAFSGEKVPDEAALARMHASAHRNCFIANSLKSEVVVVPVAP